MIEKWDLHQIYYTSSLKNMSLVHHNQMKAVLFLYQRSQQFEVLIYEVVLGNII